MKTPSQLGIRFLIVVLVSFASLVTVSAATFVVRNTNDSGPGSLRQAVLDSNAAAGADAIIFDSSFTSARMITLESGIFVNPGTSNSLTIVGPGANLLTISGNNSAQIFFISDGTTASISGMTITQGGAAGAIDNRGNLTVSKCAFTFNTRTAIHNVPNLNPTLKVIDCSFDSNSHSAIYVQENTSANISGSTFTNNTGDSGGAIFNDGAITVSGCTFTNNTVNDTSATANGGGAIYHNGPSAIISASIFTGNTATGTGSGGAIINRGDYGPMTITDSTFANNTTALGGGGAVFVDNNTVTISKSSFTNNSTTGGNPSVTCRGSGGAIEVCGSGNLTIAESLLSGNSAHNFGGGIHYEPNGSGTQVRLTNTTVSGNASGSQGGGVSVSAQGTLTIDSCTLYQNSDVDIYSSDSGTHSTSVRNSIVSAMFNNVGAFTQFSSQGYNLYGSYTASNGGVFSGNTSGNINNPNFGLAPLANNGGLTRNHALLSGSPALDHGQASGLALDQRGLPRPYDNQAIANASGGDGSDIGAFEDQPTNTSAGNNVTATAPAGDAMVAFSSATQGGTTSFAALTTPSPTGAPPAGYVIRDDAPAYEITTSASYSGTITVCFTASAITDPSEFARVRILHLEDGVLVDRTDLSSIDFASRTVCAQVTSLSPFVTALAAAPVNRVLNISTRMKVLTGDQVLIGGFIITGNESKRVLLRGIGPSLSAAGIGNPLADPVLELHGSDGSILLSNDNWKSSQESEIQGTGAAPTNDLESAIVATLGPGSYTAIMSGVNDGVGIGLIEAYDLAPASNSVLANISTRGRVEGGDNVMIGGFILSSSNTADSRVIIRAIGPSLAQAGIQGALADPNLELRDSSGTLVASNNNWRDNQEAEIQATGIPPNNNLEAAIVRTLPAGAYTAIVAGVNGGTGIALVEVYRLQ